MPNLNDQIHYSVNPGPDFRAIDALPRTPVARFPAKFIAFYLPQFHREPVNDAAWGKRFTEWVNVTKNFPKFQGHLQPRLPIDLGFYDLKNPEILHEQAEIANRGGLYGFAIHDYWFSGETILRSPLETLLRTPSIDLRFCLNWANENWTMRWDGGSRNVLIGADGRPEEARGYIESIASALADPRYIRIGDRPLLMLYRLKSCRDPRRTVETLKERALSLGLGELFVASFRLKNAMDADPAELGLDAMVLFPPHGPVDALSMTGGLKRFDPNFHGRAVDYDTFSEFMLNTGNQYANTWPGVAPTWDNTARRNRDGLALCNISPQRYERWLRRSAEKVAERPPEERFVFINAWNEWAEGAILEPCRHFGYAYLAATRRVADDLAADRPVGGAADTVTETVDRAYRSIPSWWRGAFARVKDKAIRLKRRHASRAATEDRELTTNRPTRPAAPQCRSGSPR